MKTTGTDTCHGYRVRRERQLPDTQAAVALLGELLSLSSETGPRRLDGPFALYGAGKLGHMAKEFFAHVGLAPTVVIDANAEMLRADLAWRFCEMVSPHEVPIEWKQGLPLVVSIATVCFGELVASLREQGWQDIIPLYDVMEAYRDRYPIGNGWFMGDIDPVGQANIEQVLAGWSDDRSRAAHVQFLAWHRLREDWVFTDAPVEITSRYFIPEIVDVLGGQETFVDIGSHRGEIAAAFREHVRNKFDEIIMVEPDAQNASVIRSGLCDLPDSVRGRHRLMTRALSRRKGYQRFFSGLGYGSQLCQFGGDSIEVTTLDELPVAPSYVKLHLEGHEWETLQGAEQSLRRHRPLLAVTIYHNESGMWQLPYWLMERLRDYRYYLRLHSWCGTGAVMYGIPAERQAASPA